MPDQSHSLDVDETRSKSSTVFGPLVLVSCIIFFALFVVGISIAFKSYFKVEPGTVEPAAAITIKPQPATVRLPGALEAINAYREKKHLPALVLNDQLTESAQTKADDLVLMNYWAHSRQGMTPWDFLKNAGYQYERAGENLAKCWPDTDALVNAWIDSPTHEAVLTGNYKEVGFGIAHSTRDDCNYVVGHFAMPVLEDEELPATGVSR